MKRLGSGVVWMTAMVLALPGSATGQDGAREGRGPAMGRDGMGVEMLMRMRERLALSEDQLQRLDALRSERVQARAARQAEMAELRSRVLAGELDRSALRETMEGRREAMREAQRRNQERVDAILNESQRGQVREMRARADGFRMGRESAMRQGRGMRGGRGFREGGPPMRGGRGFREGGPGMRGGPGGWAPRFRDGGPRGMRGGRRPGEEGRDTRRQGVPSA